MLNKLVNIQKDAPIAVFDSGVGGISVLRALVELMPNENYYYYGDSENAPYGTKSLELVQRLTLEHVDMFLKNRAKAVVVACNTATSAAIDILREKYKGIPVIGIEPALKPAVLSKDKPTVVVMATPMTLREEKFHRLMQCYKEQALILPLPCPGLVEYIEKGDVESQELEAFLRKLFLPYSANRIDSVVLGCTHYPFIRKILQKVLGDGVILYEGGPGTARETKRRLQELDLCNPSEETGKIWFANSSMSKEKESLCQFLLKYGIEK